MNDTRHNALQNALVAAQTAYQIALHDLRAKKKAEYAVWKKALDRVTNTYAGVRDAEAALQTYYAERMMRAG